MRVKRWSCAFLAALVLLATVALPATAAALRLPMDLGRAKATLYAEHTCGHDSHCVRSGVTGCARETPHLVRCQMFVDRSTPAQGRYTCRKLVRVTLDPAIVDIIIAGSSRWSCH